MYPDHSEIQVGDSIRFDQGRNSGDIVAVIAGDFAEYNVSEPGVMVKAQPFGLLFIPASRFAEQRVALERRGTTSPLWRGP